MLESKHIGKISFLLLLNLLCLFAGMVPMDSVDTTKWNLQEDETFTFKGYHMYFAENSWESENIYWLGAIQGDNFLSAKDAEFNVTVQSDIYYGYTDYFFAVEVDNGTHSTIMTYEVFPDLFTELDYSQSLPYALLPDWKSVIEVHSAKVETLTKTTFEYQLTKNEFYFNISFIYESDQILSGTGIMIGVFDRYTGLSNYMSDQAYTEYKPEVCNPEQCIFGMNRTLTQSGYTFRGLPKMMSEGLPDLLQDPTNNDNTWFVPLVVGVGLVSVSTIAYFGNKSLQKKKFMNQKSTSKINADILRQTQAEFEISDKSLLMLLGQKTTYDEEYVEELKSKIPQEIFQYKFLMHPTRLMMVKLLDSEIKLSSVEIKNALGINWGDYSSHIRALEKKGYVEVFDEIDNTGRVSNVYLTDYAKSDYQVLCRLLSTVVTPHSPIEQVLNIEYPFKNELYPDTVK